MTIFIVSWATDFLWTVTIITNTAEQRGWIKLKTWGRGQGKSIVMKVNNSYVISRLLPLQLLSRFSHVRLCDPIDGSPPGSPVPGILQARTLEWVAISFSDAWNWKWKWSHSVMSDLATPWTAAHQAPPSMGFSRQEYWSGVPLSSPNKQAGDFNRSPTNPPHICPCYYHPETQCLSKK